MKKVICAFQKGLENHQKSGKKQWKVREFWKGYWVAVNRSLAAILESQPLARRKQTVVAIYIAAPEG